MSYPDNDALMHVLTVKAVDVTLTADFDLAAAFPAKGFARRLYVGTAGNVAVRRHGETTGWHVYKNVPAGSYLDGCFVTVGSTANGTTAADIIAEH